MSLSKRACNAVQNGAGTPSPADGGVAAALLGGIHVLVCAIHEVRDGFAGDVAGDAKAEGDVHLGSGAWEKGVVVEGTADAFGHARRLFAVGGRQDDDELLAAVAVCGVGFADELLDDAAQFRKHGIAAQMPVGVVVFLEMIDIQDADGQGIAVAQGAVHLGLHLPEEMAGVVEAGQLVGQAQLAVAHLAASQVVLDALAVQDLLAQLVCPALHLLFQVFAIDPDLLLEPPLLKPLVHGVHDEFQIDEGLDQEIPRAAAQGLDDVVQGADAGDDDHGRLLVAGGDVPEHVEPGEVGQLQVQQDQVGQFGGVEIEPAGTVLGRDDLVPQVAEIVPQEFEECGFVIDKQDTGCVWRHAQARVEFMVTPDSYPLNAS